MTTEENRRHWASADLLSADAANNPRVRTVLRSRARYEVANNSYARGIVSTLANDCIGTGPRLQMLTDDDSSNRLVEQEFIPWADAISLAEKLRTMRMSRAESGEVFAMLVANPKVDSPIKLDLRLIEADQVMTPVLLRQEADLLAIDGIIFDRHGNPTEYHVLKRHPGDNIARWTLDFDRVPAASMIHYFRAERPGQNRGVPEITPALPLFAQFAGTPWRSSLRPRRLLISRPCSTPTPRPTARRPTSSRWILWNSNAAWQPCYRADGALARFKRSNRRRPTASSRRKSSTKSPAA